MKRIGFIGTGVMGSAMILAAGKVLASEEIIIYDHTLSKCKTIAEKIGCSVAASAQEIAEVANTVMLCVQPTRVEPLLMELMPTLKAGYEKGEKRIISCIAAGCDLAMFDALFSAAGMELPVIRVMPNIPLRVGEGVLIFAKNHVASEADVNELMGLFKEGGLCEYASEQVLLAATPVFGCSPAYVYMFIEALADGGSEIGLSRDLSIRLAAQATLGSAAMVLESGLHVAQLRDELATPGGMTITSTNEMERLGFRGALIQGVLTAYRRSLDMT